MCCRAIGTRGEDGAYGVAAEIEVLSRIISECGFVEEGVGAVCHLQRDRCADCENKDHVIAKKLKELFESDKEELKKFTKILYAQARLIEGLAIENPTEYSNWICELISK